MVERALLQRASWRRGECLGRLECTQTVARVRDVVASTLGACGELGSECVLRRNKWSDDSCCGMNRIGAWVVRVKVGGWLGMGLLSINGSLDLFLRAAEMVRLGWETGTWLGRWLGYTNTSPPSAPMATDPLCTASSPGRAPAPPWHPDRPIHARLVPACALLCETASRTILFWVCRDVALSLPSYLQGIDLDTALLPTHAVPVPLLRRIPTQFASVRRPVGRWAGNTACVRPWFARLAGMETDRRPTFLPLLSTRLVERMPASRSLTQQS